MTNPASDINPFVEQRLKPHKLKVEPLSAFVAEFRGSLFSIDWLQKNYAFMLCGFHPKDVIEDEAVYSVCMQYAPAWMKLVQSKRPEDLLLSGTHYADTCVE